MIIKKICSILCLSVSMFANASLIDLSSWSATNLDFTGGQAAGNWVLNGDNTAVTQTVNADPSVYLNNLNQTSYSIDGSWQVQTSSDNDFMGFVFGYQNSSNFYLFDWKQGSQGFYGSNGNAGMAIKKYTGGTGDGLTDLSLGELWENQTNKGDMEILATNQGSGKGWNNFTLYDFHLDFNLAVNEIHIVVSEGANVLWDSTVIDSTFTSGQFGFYNFSQGNVRYAGFEQEGGTIVNIPEPSLIFLSVLGLLLISLKRQAY